MGHCYFLGLCSLWEKWFRGQKASLCLSFPNFSSPCFYATLGQFTALRGWTAMVGQSKKSGEVTRDKSGLLPPSRSHPRLPNTAIHCEPGGLIHIGWVRAPEDPITSRSCPLADNQTSMSTWAFQAMLPHHNPGETQNHCKSSTPHLSFFSVAAQTQ